MGTVISSQKLDVSNLKSQNSIIKVSNLEKKYGEFSALRGVSFEIQKGSIYGVIGLSGAGKTSLIRIMSMIESPTSGNVVINDKDIFKLNKEEVKSIKKEIGMIFQHFNLLSSRNVYDNVSFALECYQVPKNQRHNKIMEMLDLVGLIDKKDNYPSQLSGGQKQRVAIARALVNNPSIIFSDEATSALDPMTTGSILELLKKLQKEFNLTVILITHQIEIVKNICDNICILKEGLVIEEGLKDEIFQNPKQEYTKKMISHTFF